MSERLKALLPPTLRIALGRFRRRLRPFPYVERVDRLVAAGCRFEISNEWERRRVESLGGEPEFLREFLASVRAGETVYDIGACVGLYALHAALLGAGVAAFEPDPSLRRRLARNVRLNRLGGVVEIVPWAVSDRPGTAPLYSEGLVGRSPTLEPVPGRPHLTVATDAIDRALAAGALPPPDLVKIDVEGAEILALRGMRETLRRPERPRRIYLELHPGFLAAFGSSAEECLALLADASYSMVSQQPRAEQLHCVLVGRDGG